MAREQEQSGLPEDIDGDIEGVEEDIAPARVVSFNELHWSQVWQLPLLLLGMGLFFVGIWSVWPEKPNHDFDGKLEGAAQYLAAKNLEEAGRELDEVKDVLFAEDQGGKVEQQGRYYHLLGDLLYLKYEDDRGAKSTQTLENNRAVVTMYDEAVDRGEKLGPISVQRKAETLLAMGKVERVYDELKALGDVDAGTKRKIYKRLVEYQYGRRFDADINELLGLISRYGEMLEGMGKAERLGEEIWIAELSAQLMLESEDGEGAIDYLNKKIIRFGRGAGADALAGLKVKLAKAYDLVGELGKAKHYYEVVQQLIKPNDALNADVYAGLGMIKLSEGDNQSIAVAREYFTVVTKQFPDVGSNAYVQSLIGLADCEARLGEYPASMDHFRQAVALLLSQSGDGGMVDRRKERLKEIIQAHIRYAMERRAYEQGLEYLQTMLPLFGQDVPADVLLSFAMTHERIAEVYDVKAQEIDPKLTNDFRPEKEKAWRYRNQQSVIHYGKAAGRYLEHARAVTISNNKLHGESLWAAAQNFDKANLWQKSVNVYAEFMETRESDPRRLRAIVNHGKALFALGQYDAAGEDFRLVVKDHPRTLEAYESRVMLARTFEKQGEIDKALRGLEQVIEDDPVITPDSKQYRESLIELGRLYYQQVAKDVERSENAIEVLTKAVERYGDRGEGGKLRYWLADSYRQSVKAIDDEMARQLSHKRQLELSSERNRRLQKAQEFFQSAKRQLELRDYESLSPLEKMYLRNSYFYRADCAFDMQHYGQAIALYDEAARRWEKDPASMVALIQIVNSYCELGQFREAKIAHDNAYLQLKRIPDEEFEKPGLPMTRKLWEDWLRWESELQLFETSDEMAEAGG
ncbi:Tetratricopeptide repeat protein [Poriferisphaera corsica]|uniref:Tetratricopeptide repeat protein n=1 Tax=Poriferisphaera corsica TaxID=2528020 RepID=A0A517YSG3_9BACT|nr:tetratricopeptide repeat protein [Poriferisphaera corsica]QDU33158.1 Tetratricopeptide repeat protein [Poriferisphaera corsica]